MNVRQYTKLVPLYLSVLTAIFSIVFWLVVDKPFDPAYKNLHFVNYQQEKIYQFEREADSLLHSLANQFTRTPKEKFHTLTSLFLQEEVNVFTDNKLLYGDKQRYFQLIQSDFLGTKSRIFHIENGDLLIRKHSIDYKGIKINFTKSTTFPFGATQAEINEKNGLALYNIENKLLGYLSPLQPPFSSILSINSTSFTLLFLSFFLFSIWIIPKCIGFYKSNGILQLSIYVGIWCITIKLLDLAFAYRYPMFPYFVTTPYLEGSTWLNPTYLSRLVSIGCLTFWLGIIVLKLHRTEIYKQLSRINGLNKQIFSISLLFFGFLSSQFILEQVKSFYHIFGVSSQFSNLFLEKTQYILLLLSIHLVGIFYFLLLHPLFILFNAINKNKIQAFVSIGTSSVCWYFLLAFSQAENYVSLLLPVAWVTQYVFNLPQGFYSIRHKTSFYSITIVYLFSIFATVGSYYFDKEKAQIYQNEIKDVILTSSTDDFTHTLLSLQKNLYVDSSAKLIDKNQAIRNLYIQTAYTDLFPQGVRFETRLAKEWRNILDKNYINTSYKGIYANNNTREIAILVSREDNWLAAIFQVPRINTEQLQIRETLSFHQKNTLIQQKAGIALIQLPTFETLQSYGEQIYVTKEFRTKSQENGTNFSSFRIGSKQISQHFLNKNTFLVIQLPAYSWTIFWENLAFISLVSFLILSFYFLLFTGIGFARTSKVTSLTTKIVLYIQASFLIPLLITTVFVIRFFDREIQRNQNESHLQQTELVQKQLEIPLRNWDEGQLNDSSLNALLSGIQMPPLQAIRIKSTQGETIYSSSDCGDVGNLVIETSALEIKDDSLLMVTGRIDRQTSIPGIMIPIRGMMGEKIGVLEVYFMDAGIQYAHRITEIIESILLVFIFIFNSLFLISFLISKKLINPIKEVAIRLKNTTLNELTEKELIPIVKHDEIGLLVDAYNGMIKKLEESKDAIAEAEKQTAWQEIARQVAHEIKNPLTPMKLSIQQLQRTLTNNPGQATKEVIQSLSLLIEQIDDISTIASSFSSYAQMPIPKKVRMNLAEVLQKSIQFILTSEQISISFEHIREEIWVLQDPSFMDRLLKNILLNAVQSVPKGRMPILHVDIQKRIKSAVISIQDNGSGIPESLKDKIFLPHFSTKKIGSGIGLAIAKKGIETMGGNIWFESQEGVGTTFYVEVPLQGAII